MYAGVVTIFRGDRRSTVSSPRSAAARRVAGVASPRKYTLAASSREIGASVESGDNRSGSPLSASPKRAGALVIGAYLGIHDKE